MTLIKYQNNRLILKQNQIIEELQLELSNTSTSKLPVKKDFEKGFKYFIKSWCTLYEIISRPKDFIEFDILRKTDFEENEFRTPEPNELIGLLFNTGAGFQRGKEKDR